MDFPGIKDVILPLSLNVGGFSWGKRCNPAFSSECLVDFLGVIDAILPFSMNVFEVVEFFVGVVCFVLFLFCFVF